MNNLLVKNLAKGPGAKIYFCKVIRFLPSSNTADVVTIDNNISLLGCNIACSTPAGFVYGARYIPTHDDRNSEVEYVNSSGDIYCIAAFLENDYNNAAILGFLFPMETTLAIAEYGLYIFRHESDVMWMVRSDGTVQMYHPSGSIIKIGDDNSNELTDDREQGGIYPAKTDGLYVRPSEDYNEQKETNLFIKWHSGQELTLDNDGNVIVKTKENETIKATLTMTPGGVVTIETTEQINAITKDLNVTASGNVVADVSGNMTANIAGNAIVDAANAAINASTLASLTSDNNINIIAANNIVIKAGVTATIAGANINGLSNAPSNRKSSWV